MRRFGKVIGWGFVIVFVWTVTALRAEDRDSLSVRKWPDYICADSNRITGNLTELDEVFRKWSAVGSDTAVVVSILHLGDSHIQAGFFSGAVRDSLQAVFGDAGRGLVAPLKLLGTNEPPDYTITSPNSWYGAKCVDLRPEEEVGVSGMVLATSDREIEFRIEDKTPFDRVLAFHHARAPLLEVSDSLDAGIWCPEPSDELTSIQLDSAVCRVVLKARVTDTAYAHPCFYGFSLDRTQNGVRYHSVGINGNTFSAFVRNPQIFEQAAWLEPDLVIVSLGTNDCSGSRFDREFVERQVANLLDQIARSMPTAAVLMTTPMQCCRAVRSRGRIYRRENPHVASMRKVILDEADMRGIPVWDFYTVAGGRGAVTAWYGSGMMNRDRIHLTREGYQMQGEMLVEALLAAYSDYLRRCVEVAPEKADLSEMKRTDKE